MFWMMFLGFLTLLACFSPVSGQCSTCVEERCYDNGECIFGCVPGFAGRYCDEECPPRCLNKVCHLHLILGAITCTEGCEDGYCGTQCEKPCPGGCVTCDRQCGSCNVTFCPERHYGTDCSRICNPKYGECDRETGKCIRCRRGFYGDDCNQVCRACFTRAENILDTCLSGCDTCQVEETCPTGFYGDSCQLPCSLACDKPGGCNRATGECFDGCVTGYHRMTCNCTCSKHCLSGKCNRVTGECSDGCMTGYHGLTCNYTCSRHCLSGKCNTATGECSDGCMTGYHGLTCNCRCSKHCLSGKCNSATGECSDGCVSGYHGLTCNRTCNKFCVGGNCNQRNGVCTYGCISGYESKLHMCEQDKDKGTHTLVVIALAGLKRSKGRHGKGRKVSFDVTWPLLKQEKGIVMTLSSKKVHSSLQVQNHGKELTNMARSGVKKTLDQFSTFCGTCSSPISFSTDPSCLTSYSYWETKCKLTWNMKVIDSLLEIGIVDGQANLDNSSHISDLCGSVCVSVWTICSRHINCICINVLRKEMEGRTYPVNECVPLSLPKSGVVLTFTFGLLLDVAGRRVAFIDVERGELLCKIDMNFTQEVFPMFYVNPNVELCAIKMELVTGGEISIDDRKKKLIQEALSD